MIATQDDLAELVSCNTHVRIPALPSLELAQPALGDELDTWIGHGLAIGATASMVLVLGALIAVEYWLVWQAVFAPWLNLLETARIW